MFAPQGAPFSVYDMSSWSRTIFVPLSIIWATKARHLAAAARAASSELLADVEPAAATGAANSGSRRPDWKTLFGTVDRLLKLGERLPGAAALRRVALKRAGDWMIERLAESDGLSAILPAMANSALALKLLGYDESHPLLAEALRHLDELCISEGDTHPRPALHLAGVGHRAVRPRPVPERHARRRPAPRAGGHVVDRQADAAAWRLGGPQSGCARRLVLRDAQRVLSRRRRHLHGADGAGASARGRRGPGARSSHRPRLGLDAGHAERRWRVGQLRPRQRQGLADPRPVRRSQRDDRSQHRRHHRARAREPVAFTRATASTTRS